MSVNSLRSVPFWHDGVQPPLWPALRDNVTTDVCVIGAGIAGLTTAWMLAKAGMSVAVLEALDLAAGETSRSTAHIAVPDDGYWEIEREHGIVAARHVADSFGKAIDTIESIVTEDSIACDFERVDGLLVSCAADPGTALTRELEAARRADVEVELLSQTPEGYAGFEGPCLRFPRQGQLHPFKYLLGLAAALPRRCALFTGTRATAIEDIGDGVVVRTDGGTVHAGAAVVATNTPFNERLGLHLRQAAYQTYVVAGLIHKDTLPRRLFWDDGDPYHYVRLAPYDASHDVLIVGGEDHRTGQEDNTASAFDELEDWVARHLPAPDTFRWRWSGEIIEPVDYLASLGREPGSRNVYLISGDSGNGITHGTIGARIVSSLVLGQSEPWAEVYDPARSRTQQVVKLAQQQADIAAQYTRWLTAGDVPDVSEIGYECGAIIRRGLHKIAVYRNNEGDLYANSAVCPHMGCIVQWNCAERTWDCPCHGSRFTAYGALLHGPADRRLTSFNQPHRLQRLIGDADASNDRNKTTRTDRHN